MIHPAINIPGQALANLCQRNDPDSDQTEVLDAMKNKRVLHVIVGIGVGGAETALLRSSKELVLRGCEIRVLCLFQFFDLLKEFEDAGVKVYFLSRIFRRPKLLLEVLNWRPQHLMAWLPLAHLVSIVLQPVLGANVLIWNVRQTLRQFDRLPLRSKFFLKLSAVFSRRPDAIIDNSNRGLHDHQKFGFLGQRELVIPNGFDDQVTWTESEKQQARRKFGLGEQSLIFSLDFPRPRSRLPCLVS